MSITTQSLMLSADRDAISQFLSTHIKDSIHVAAVTPDKRDFEGKWFGSDFDAATAWVVERNNAGKNVYFTLNNVKPGFMGKPDNDYMLSARFIGVDVDPPKDGSEFDIGKKIDQILGLNPSFIIASGAGLQAFWRTDVISTDFASTEGLGKAVAARLGGDSCHSRSHLFRLPGTVNFPNKVKRNWGRVEAMATLLIPDTGRVHSLADLELAFGSTMSEKLPRRGYSGDFAIITIVDLFPAPNPKILALITDPQRGDRSADVYALACEMAKCGYAPTAIMGILMNPDYPIHAHLADQSNPQRNARRVVGKAMKQSPSVAFAEPALLPEGAKPITDALLSANPDEPPRPLRRETPAAEPFPVEALGEVLSGAALAITDRVQCPVAMGAQSVLAVASLAVQGHADINIPPHDKLSPPTLYLITVAGSGDRKSAADHDALKPVHEYEVDLRRRHRIDREKFETASAAWNAAHRRVLKEGEADRGAIEAALRILGPEPQPPLVPMVLMPEPTLEGLYRAYVEGRPSLGLFSDEGGQFVGGHGMNQENRLKTSAGISHLWDGKPIKRVRGGEGTTILSDKRLAVHLMMQPDVAAQLLSDPVLKDQGLLSRLLVVSPSSLSGTRFQRPVDPQSAWALAIYHDRVAGLFNVPLPLADGSTNDLAPRKIGLSVGAVALWSEYADKCEQRIGKRGQFEPIKGLANKLPEHAVRLAGVMALFDDISCELVPEEVMSRAILLAEYYAAEALRLFDVGMVSHEILLAERLLEWLHTNWTEPEVGLRQIYQFGPQAIRDKATAKASVQVLVDHGWLVTVQGGARIKGEMCREAWCIRR